MSPGILGPVGRCAYQAESRGDPMIGTGFPAARILLLEDAGPWGRAGLTDSTVPSEVARRLDAVTASAGIRVQLIRQTGRSPRSQGTRRWGLADARPGRGELRWGEVGDVAELFDRTALDSTTVRTDEPVYLVCAHGNHDVCCAVRGRATAAALAALRPGQVWETSHLGGDRFAASVLVLPAGQLYGQVRPNDAQQLTRAVDSDEVWVDRLRGRIGTHPAAQVAEAHVRAQLGLRERGAVRIAEVTGSPELAAVRLTVPAGDVEVSLVPRRIEVQGLTCARPGPGAFVSWVVTGVVDASVTART